MTGQEEKIRFPSRKNPRLKGFDYSSVNYYFITICTRNKQCLFGLSGNLTPLGKLAEQGLQQIPLHFPEIRVDKYVVMPNHVHAILILKPGTTGLSTVVGSYKSSVTKQIHAINPKITVWQTSFHDHVIRNQPGYEKIWSYIETNPLKWEDDCFYR